MLEEYSNIEIFDEIEDFDHLLTLIEKLSACCVIVDLPTMKKFERYVHILPDNSTIVPIIETSKDKDKSGSFKIYLTLFDDKRQILESVQRAVDGLKLKDTNNIHINELSSREKIILQLIAKGFSSKMIADKLSISIQTVSTHRKNISRKLEIKTVSGLTVYAIINNLITPEESNLS